MAKRRGKAKLDVNARIGYRTRFGFMFAIIFALWLTIETI
jgi:hypothetical protein